MTSTTTEQPDRDIAIEVKGVSKAYRIWRDPAARLKYPVFRAIGGLIPKAFQPRFLSRRISDTHETPYYNDFYALKDIELTVRRGESASIIGRNGSGKSTLLQIIAGTLTPTAGTVKVNGRVAALLELGSGFNPEFTGRENVYLNASILGLTQKEIDKRYEDIANFADIGDFVDQPVKTYSSGMMMRLAFAVLAHVNADILIVDEALAVGDVFFVQKCMRFIREFQKKGTLLLVTHDTVTATSLCPRALWLHKGISKADGFTEKVANMYLEEVYAEREGPTLFTTGIKTARADMIRRPIEKKIDQRAALINQSNLRNDLEVFDFNRNSPAFGAGAMIIDYVELLDAATHAPLAYGIGGEDVILNVRIKIYKEIRSPIVGFFLKNHIGQQLFGDNTYLSHKYDDLVVPEGYVLTAKFKFQMPYLPAGDYMFCVACASGTQETHLHQHWLHDALPFKSHSKLVTGGLIGLPMLEIKLEAQNAKS